MILPRKLARYLLLIVMLGVLLCLVTVYMMAHTSPDTDSQPEDHMAHTSPDTDSQPEDHSLIVSHIINRVYTDGMLDHRNEHIIIPNIVTPYIGESVPNVDITICTQATPENLHYLKHMSMFWRGPISVTVLSYGPAVKHALHQMLLLHMCHEGVRKFVSFHLMMPASHPPESANDLLSMPLTCDSFENDERHSTQKNFQNLDLPYPQNTMRSISITYSKTAFILMIDIDIMPSKNLAQNFQMFIESHKEVTNNDKIAYVIPVFESKIGITKFETKEDLVEEYERGNVRVFYIDDCRDCQATTDYSRWLLTQSSPEPEVLYQAKRTYVWEPFYIARKRHLPLYDGRFKQYGFNRISQICEAHMAGFVFVVMDNLFLVHDGFKFRNRFHPTRQRELEANRKLFATFKQEMKNKYSDSPRSC